MYNALIVKSTLHQAHLGFYVNISKKKYIGE